MNNVIPTESLDKLFTQILKTNEWKIAQEDFNNCQNIFIIGNGGNLAVADHGAVDITRLSTKLAHAPGSGILATSIISDSSFKDWFSNWLNAHTNIMDSISKSKCMVIGISSSGTAHNIVNCLENASNKGMKSLMISGRESPEVINEKYNSVQIGTDFYHTGEVVSLMLMYQLIHGSGGACPSISKKLNATSFDRLVKNK